MHTDFVDPASALQALIDAAVAGGIPGISVAVVGRDGVVSLASAGQADVVSRVPVRSDMLFGIGSITKTFVAVVILQLAEEGRVALDATAPSVLGAAVQGIPNADVATIAQLLNHTGGVPSWEDDPAWIRDGRGAALDVNRVWGKADTLAYVAGHAPLSPPGLQFGYANTNFTLLGLVIEKLTGEEAMSEIRRRILAPLGIDEIYLEGFEPLPRSRLSHRYHWITPEFRSTAGVNAAFTEVHPGLLDVSASNLSVEWTAGGMVATARALASFGAALRDGRLLSPRSTRFMTQWFPVASQATHDAFRNAHVGHNLFRSQYADGLAVVGHDGDVLGFSGSLYWVEGTDVVVAVLCNVGSMHAGAAAGGVAYSVAKTTQFIEAVRRLGTR